MSDSDSDSKSEKKDLPTFGAGGKCTPDERKCLDQLFLSYILVAKGGPGFNGYVRHYQCVACGNPVADVGQQSAYALIGLVTRHCAEVYHKLQPSPAKKTHYDNLEKIHRYLCSQSVPETISLSVAFVLEQMKQQVQ